MFIRAQSNNYHHHDHPHQFITKKQPNCEIRNIVLIPPLRMRWWAASAYRMADSGSGVMNALSSLVLLKRFRQISHSSGADSDPRRKLLAN